MNKLHCRHCGYQWPQRTEKPVLCPRCKSRRWDREDQRSQYGDRDRLPTIEQMSGSIDFGEKETR